MHTVKKGSKVATSKRVKGVQLQEGDNVVIAGEVKTGRTSLAFKILRERLETEENTKILFISEEFAIDHIYVKLVRGLREPVIGIEGKITVTTSEILRDVDEMYLYMESQGFDMVIVESQYILARMDGKYAVEKTLSYLRYLSKTQGVTSVYSLPTHMGNAGYSLDLGDSRVLATSRDKDGNLRYREMETENHKGSLWYPNVPYVLPYNRQ